MRRIRRSVASSSVFAGIWEALWFVCERFVSVQGFPPTEYPFWLFKLSFDEVTVYLTQEVSWRRSVEFEQDGKACLVRFHHILQCSNEAVCRASVSLLVLLPTMV